MFFSNILEHFWVCPLQREQLVVRCNNCRNSVKESYAFCCCKGSWCLRPLPWHRWLCGRQGEWGGLWYISTFMSLWHQHTESPLDLLHTLLIMLLELFGSFFKVMEIMLGSRARILRARVAGRATALPASPLLQPGIRPRFGTTWEAWVPRPWIFGEAEGACDWATLSCVHLWKGLARNMVILTC